MSSHRLDEFYFNLQTGVELLENAEN